MMKPSYFVSERVRLRAMEPEDLEIMYAMENDPQTWDVTRTAYQCNWQSLWD